MKVLRPKTRECVISYPVGNKKVCVWLYLAGEYRGIYWVSCSLYPELGGLFFEYAKAMQRAEKIVLYHNRQLEFSFPECQTESMEA